MNYWYGVIAKGQVVGVAETSDPLELVTLFLQYIFRSQGVLMQQIDIFMDMIWQKSEF